MHNALTFEFDDLQPDSAMVELKWEKIEVPFKVAVDVHESGARKFEKTVSHAFALYVDKLE